MMVGGSYVGPHNFFTSHFFIDLIASLSGAVIPIAKEQTMIKILQVIRSRGIHRGEARAYAAGRVFLTRTLGSTGSVPWKVSDVLAA